MLHILSAVAVYVFFKEREPMDVPTNFALLVVVPSASITLENYLNLGSPVFDASCLQSFFAFYAVLLCSMMAYRLSPFHPLSQYPGPLSCKISKVYIMWLAYTGKLHIYYKSLHDTYGPIVRIGPNDLSINEKKLIPFILGSRGMPKGPIWDARRNRQLGKDKTHHSVIDIRDLKLHGQVRRRWNEAFSAEPLKDYQGILAARAEELCDHFERLSQRTPGGVATLNIAQWISFFSFDFMGSIAFGGVFDLMGNQDAHGLWNGMEKCLNLQGIIQHSLWAAITFQSTPYFSSGMRKFGQFAMKQAKLRISTKAESKDLFYHLYEATADLSSPSSYEAQLSTAVTDSTLIIIAGSDTSASTMSSVFALLLRHPDTLRRLIEELEDAFSTVDSDDRRVIEVEKLQNLHYLNAVINETLRLFPPVPTAVQRSPAKGSGGTMLGDSDIFIPEGTGVIVPPYCIHRDERYFSPSPDSFIPERWLNNNNTSSPDANFKTDREAFIPFSYGPANCAGKPLALMEIRYVVALLITRFDIELVPTKNQDVKGGSANLQPAWEDYMEDRFVFAVGPLEVSLRPRAKSSTRVA